MERIILIFTLIVVGWGLNAIVETQAYGNRNTTEVLNPADLEYVEYIKDWHCPEGADNANF